MKEKKKKIILISLVCIVSFSILMYEAYLSKINSFKILVKNNNNCNEKKYYFNYANKDIYIDCLDNISIKKKGKIYDLKDAINQNVITFEQLLKGSKNKIEYWDGGSILYKYKDFSIIVYQRYLEDNKQCNYIVISNKNASVNDYCD